MLHHQLLVKQSKMHRMLQKENHGDQSIDVAKGSSTHKVRLVVVVVLFHSRCVFQLTEKTFLGLKLEKMISSKNSNEHENSAL